MVNLLGSVYHEQQAVIRPGCSKESRTVVFKLKLTKKVTNIKLTCTRLVSNKKGGPKLRNSIPQPVLGKLQSHNAFRLT